MYLPLIEGDHPWGSLCHFDQTERALRRRGRPRFTLSFLRRLTIESWQPSSHAPARPPLRINAKIHDDISELPTGPTGPLLPVFVNRNAFVISPRGGETPRVYLFREMEFKPPARARKNGITCTRAIGYYVFIYLRRDESHAFAFPRATGNA